MPLPLVFIAIGAGTAALGIGKGVKAGIDMKDASDTNKSANRLVDDAKESLERARKAIQNKNIKVGISIKPNTNVELLRPYIDKIDLVLIMSVEPGKGGQEFMPKALDKIE